MGLVIFNNSMNDQLIARITNYCKFNMYVLFMLQQQQNTSSILITFTACFTLYVSCVLVKFYCDVITKSCLQLIGT